MKTYNVYLPVCYYEVFSVEAANRKQAIQRVRECHASVEQNCTVSNARWSRRITVIETDERGHETARKVR